MPNISQEAATKQADETPRETESRQMGVVAVARVARALVGAGALSELALGALEELCDALAFDLAVFYAPDPDDQHVLCRFEAVSRAGSTIAARERLAFEDEAWRFVVAGSPLVFRDSGGWLIPNPFEPVPPSWLVLPLIAEGLVVGAVMASASSPISLDPLAVATLSSIGDLLSAGIATARLRMEVQRTEAQRERLRLAAQLHDGLAQDLALAVRELAFLETAPAADLAAASQARLRDAVTAAHHVVRAGLDDLSGSVPEAGLAPAIRLMCERFRRRGLAVYVEGVAPFAALDAAAVVVVLRVLSESLENVQRHSGQSTAQVAFAIEGGVLHLRVGDAGPGFGSIDVGLPGDGHYGIAIMRERARSVGGMLTIGQRPGGGSLIDLAVPMRSSNAGGVNGSE